MVLSLGISKTMSLVIVVLLVAVVAGGIYYYSAVTAPPQYPSKPITFIVSWSAGGGTDRTARMIAALLENMSGWKTVVENRVGGGGTVGHLAMATASPDGYTVGIITFELSTFEWMGLANVSYKNFKPVLLYNRDPAAVIVRADAPWKDVIELTNYIKANPGKLKASGTAKGGVWDIGRIGWLKTAGVDPEALPWVPSTGAAPCLQELIAGGIDICTCSLPEAGPLIEAGKVKALAVMADERNPAFPDVPTLKEKGINWAFGTWRGVAVPKDTPDHIVKTLHDAIKKVIDSPQWKDFMSKNGFGMAYLPSSEFAKFLENDYKVVGELLKAAGYVK
ncbi:MAG: tripartite tricarboxylate transporter substrate binding protein [Sulfolobales archaeon]|nr:tripartite tricarboxylate transporter substrate binding protein [Sulfolobales archaeon]MCX8185892.1 tripartite tricarboxylate transporter substrate binding protein [Sulfolobales archaeon]MDW7969149.1 tripartite tricarboxylate transporter substrate binding protein [Sulfolobales archaeon]